MANSKQYIPYFEKLKDPRWQKKRLEVMERAQFKCEDCGSSDKTLHIHHQFYEKGKDPWDYHNCLLVCCCEDCHSIRERISQLALATFQQMDPKIASEFLETCCLYWRADESNALFKHLISEIKRLAGR